MTWINQINMNGSMICMEISFLLVSINAISYLTYLNIIKNCIAYGTKQTWVWLILQALSHAKRTMLPQWHGITGQLWTATYKYN